jgi:hypothetical protein
MASKDDPVVARSEAAFVALVFAVFACAARLIDDPRLVAADLDDGGMGMVYYERCFYLLYISWSRLLTGFTQGPDVTLYQPRIDPVRSRPVPHSHVFLLVLGQLPSASLAACWAGRSYGSGSWSPCQLFQICRIRPPF